MAERKGDWFQTITGRQFWALDPRPEDVSTLDIAWSLARTCRYNGHCFQHYSVAQHSVHVARLVEKRTDSAEVIFAALMHDASEAYTGDMVRPLKRGMPEFKRVEEKIEDVIQAHYEILLMPDEQSLIKQADTLALALERSVLVRRCERWSADVLLEQDPSSAQEFKRGFRAWPFDTAFGEFMSTFRHLTRRRCNGGTLSEERCQRDLASVSADTICDLLASDPLRNA